LTGLTDDTPDGSASEAVCGCYTWRLLALMEGSRSLFEDQERDIASIELSRWGRVVRVDGMVGWLVADPDGVAVEPIRRFLFDFVARDNRAGSVRSYAYVLLRWWRWLQAAGVQWDKAAPS
jgi:integrase/recombinase XerD